MALFVASCQKKSTPAASFDVGRDYYPSDIGKYVIYEADSTVYDEFTFQATNYKYQIKEKIEEQFTDIEGKPALRMMRYIKKYDSLKPYNQQTWLVKDAWQVNIIGSNVEVVEENVRFTKLAFPTREGNNWDGNAKNTIGEWNYSYTYVDNPENINNVSLDKVLKVKQKDFRTLISWQDYSEKYSRGVGLVYKEVTDLRFPVTATNVAVPNIPNKTGTIYKLTIVSHGNE